MIRRAVRRAVLRIAGSAALLLVAGAGPAAAQDAWVSPKTRPTALNLGDRSFEPAGNLRLFGSVRVHPALRETLLVDDNIFLEAHDPEADLISSSTAALRLDLLPGDWEATAGGRFRWVNYAANPDQSHPEAVSETRIAFTGRTLRFEVADTFEWLEDPLNLVSADRMERIVNTASLQVGLEGRAFGGELRIADRLYDFREPFGTLDHREDTGTCTLRAILGADRALFVAYTGGLVDFARDARNDYQTHEVVGGVRGRVGAKAEVEAAMGWLWQIVDASTLNPDDDAFDGAVGRLSVLWTATPRLTIRVRYTRALQFAQVGNFQVVDRGEASGEWRPHERIATRVYGLYEHTDPQALDVLDFVAAGCNVDWDVQPWFAVGLGAEYRARWTQIEDAAYRNLRAWVHATVYL